MRSSKEGAKQQFYPDRAKSQLRNQDEEEIVVIEPKKKKRSRGKNVSNNNYFDVDQ